MSELRFTVDHEWLRLEADGLVTVGITAFAQQALGDVVFVQVPELGAFGAGAEVSVLESVKAASSIGMPLDGEVVEVNDTLESSPERVNEDPLGEGWFFRFKPVDALALNDLLDQDAYARLTAEHADA
ncbi:glycine cleavage system protein GcvH [Pseudomonas sp. NFX15]|uniref:glycine cleavage system protein GcvH n=1 Tax=Pseudomonas sp. NFX15 TaxID=2816958 RepID=UPI003B8B3943